MVFLSLLFYYYYYFRLFEISSRAIHASTVALKLQNHPLNPPLTATTGNSAKRPKTGGARDLEDMFNRPMSTKEKEEQHTRYVIICCVDVRPFNLARQSRFQTFIGGLCPAYVQTTIHHDTMSRILDGLADAVRDSIIAKFKEQLDSALVPSHPIPAQ